MNIENIQQNFDKLNPTMYIENYKSWLRFIVQIYFGCARLVQHLKINRCKLSCKLTQQKLSQKSDTSS